MRPMKVGIVGCGNISKQYLTMSQQFPSIQIAALSDLLLDKAKAQAEAFNISRVLTVDALMADPEIDIVLNLTIPAAHGPVAMQAIENGKHVYNEKPLTVDVASARKLLAAAKAKNLRVGCAPDTFLGTSHQLCRQLIDDGVIGKPVAASALMLSRGPEGWHPNPEFFYQPGGGPMFDMGPYYLTALMNLLGPVRSIVGMAGKQITDREVGKGELAGKKIDVQIPDHVAGMLQFQNGVVGTITTSFAVSASNHDGKHPIVIYGSEGTLQVPDPNRFDGTVLLRRRGEAEWAEMPVQHTHPNGRSLGLADMAIAIGDNRPHRAAGELALAALACMEGFLKSSETRQFLDIDVDLQRPAVLPAGLDGELDATAAAAN